MTAIIASASMRALMAVVERAARSGANILLTGESGTGKELVARAIHQLSPRSHRAWVDLSCAALPEHLIESELFGHEKGAFSGADTAKQGLFEMANGGTIFLDEIGELDSRMQAKLLRVLDGVPYFRLGGMRKVPVDARVVAATNRDLTAAVAEGKFRVDLFHRLQQFVLRIPPLRERVDDIAPLGRHFLAEQNPRLTFSDAAIRVLESRAWPGNIRELRNAVIQASLLAKGECIGSEEVAIPGLLALHQAMSESAAGLDGVERRAILSALAASGGHQAKAAAQLGISRRTLSRRLKNWEECGIAAS
jgi:transcriptional regulator with PAS, ATPase and Fis domain